MVVNNTSTHREIKEEVKKNNDRTIYAKNTHFFLIPLMCNFLVEYNILRVNKTCRLTHTQILHEAFGKETAYNIRSESYVRFFSLHLHRELKN